MHICFISSLFPPYVLGGAETYLDGLVKSLSIEHEISIITTTPYRGSSSFWPRLEHQGKIRIYRFYPINVFHLYKRPRSALRKALWYLIDVYNLHVRIAIQRVLQVEKPDIVHTHILRGLSLSVWDAVKDENLPLVHTIHDYFLICFTSMLLHGKSAILCDGKRLECRLHRNVMRLQAANKPDLLISPSQFVLEQHSPTRIAPHAQRAVVRLFNETTQVFAPPEPDKPLHALFIGSVGRHKGVRYLVEAFRSLADPQVRLEIVGSGDNELELCRRLAADDQRIRFIDFLSGIDKEQAFQRANVVVLPSVWYDNAPVVILESFARGRPVIGSSIGGIPELINHEQNGLLFEPRNTDDLTFCLNRLNQDRALRHSLSIGAYASSGNYTSDIHLRKINQLYQQITK